MNTCHNENIWNEDVDDKAMQVEGNPQGSLEQNPRSTYDMDKATSSEEINIKIVDLELSPWNLPKAKPHRTTRQGVHTSDVPSETARQEEANVVHIIRI